MGSLLSTVINGKNAVKLDRVIEERFDENDIITPLGKRLVDLFKSTENSILVFISQAPDFFVELIQQKLNFDAMICPSFKIVDQKFVSEKTFVIDSQFARNFIKNLRNEGNKVVVVGTTDNLGDFLKMADIPIRFDLLEDSQDLINFLTPLVE